jgi:hypothetical protein
MAWVFAIIVSMGPLNDQKLCVMAMEDAENGIVKQTP